MVPVAEEVQPPVVVPSDEESETSRAAGSAGSAESESESSSSSNVVMGDADGSGGATGPAAASSEMTEAAVFPFNNPKGWTFEQRMRIAQMARDAITHGRTVENLVTMWR